MRRRCAPNVLTSQVVVDERLEGMHVLLSSLGGVPITIVESSFEVMSVYLQGRLQSGRSGPQYVIGCLPSHYWLSSLHDGMSSLFFVWCRFW